MKKISTLEELERFIGSVIRGDKKFIGLITEPKVDEFDFFEFYEKISSFANDYYNVTITLGYVPFSMKFSIVSYVINSFQNEDLTQKLFDCIFKMDANSNSQIPNKIKREFLDCINLANIACISENFDLSYMILNHVTQNFD